MTEQKRKFFLRPWLITQLRRISYRYGPRYQALNAAKVSRGVYKCAGCKKDFARKDIQVDHIQPIVGSEGFTTWDDYITRLFCEAEGLQVLCKDDCHKEKTRLEREARRDVANRSKKQS